MSHVRWFSLMRLYKANDELKLNFVNGWLMAHTSQCFYGRYVTLFAWTKSVDERCSHSTIMQVVRCLLPFYRAAKMRYWGAMLT